MEQQATRDTADSCAKVQRAHLLALVAAATASEALELAAAEDADLGDAALHPVATLALRRPRREEERGAV